MHACECNTAERQTHAKDLTRKMSGSRGVAGRTHLPDETSPTRMGCPRCKRAASSARASHAWSRCFSNAITSRASAVYLASTWQSAPA